MAVKRENAIIINKFLIRKQNNIYSIMVDI